MSVGPSSDVGKLSGPKGIAFFSLLKFYPHFGTNRVGWNKSVKISASPQSRDLSYLKKNVEQSFLDQRKL